MINNILRVLNELGHQATAYKSIC